MARDIDSLMAQLTLEEKATLTAGADLWSTVAVERVGLPSVLVTDGPNGARGPSLPGMGERTMTAACLPCGAALGATWDVDLAEQVGAVLGQEARTKSCRVLLAPTVNLHRSPLGGRNFESYAEDPLLAGRMAAAFVRGAQSQGVATTVKHFAGNESEIERMTADSIIDERTLRELYLLPFELAVREGGSLGIMSSYNRLNGSYVADNRELLEDILRHEWGFEGFVMTDWYAQGDTVAAAGAGLDIEMPGPARFFGAKLADAVREGRVGEPSVDAAVRRLLTTLDRVGAFDDPPPDPRSVDDPDHRAIARRAAAESTVLIRNRAPGGSPVLPLELSGLSSLALIGPGVARTAIMGGGSAQLTPHYRVSVLDAFTEALGPGVELIHEPGADLGRSLPALDAELTLEVVDGDDPAGPEAEVVTRPDGELWFFGPPSKQVGRTFSVRLAGTFTPDAGGTWEVSLAQAGRARLWLDGRVVLDGIDHPFPPGPTFLGVGSQEVRTTVDLVAGEPVEVRAEFVNPDGATLSGVRIGARPAPPSRPGRPGRGRRPPGRPGGAGGRHQQRMGVRGPRPRVDGSARRPGRADRTGAGGGPRGGRGGQRGLAGHHGLGGSGRGRAPGLVRRPGDGPRRGRRPRGHDRPRRAAAHHHPPAARTQPVVRELPGRERPDPLRRGPAHGLPLVRGAPPAGAGPVRSRPVLHELRDRHPDVVGHHLRTGHAAHPRRDRDQHR